MAIAYSLAPEFAAMMTTTSRSVLFSENVRQDASPYHPFPLFPLPGEREEGEGSWGEEVVRAFSWFRDARRPRGVGDNSLPAAADYRLFEKNDERTGNVYENKGYRQKVSANRRGGPCGRLGPPQGVPLQNPTNEPRMSMKIKHKDKRSGNGGVAAARHLRPLVAPRKGVNFKWGSKNAGEKKRPAWRSGPEEKKMNLMSVTYLFFLPAFFFAGI